MNDSSAAAFAAKLLNSRADLDKQPKDGSMMLQEYLPGEEVPTYLKWNADQKAYHTTWWNAKGKPTRAATADKLPEKDGQVVIAKDLGEAPK